jgi:hypothetical protein
MHRTARKAQKLAISPIAVRDAAHWPTPCNKIPGLTSALLSNGEIRAAMQRPRRMSRVTLIDAGSRDRLAGEMSFTEAAQPIAMNDLVTSDFACLALQNMDGRTNPRIKAGDDQDRNGWTMSRTLL